MNSSFAQLRAEQVRTTARRVSIELRDAALSLLYPKQCRVCGAAVRALQDGDACASCWSVAEQMAEAAEAHSCLKCGLPLRASTYQDNSGQSLSPRCGQCDQFAFNRARACGRYAGALREAVLRLKRQPHLPLRLRGLLETTFYRLSAIEPCDALIPMPLHPSRLAERKFNQAEVIAQALSEATGTRVHSSAVIRIKQTERHRFGMGQRERLRSLDRAFQVRAPRLVEGRALVVIDDVMTTASTADEIARTLLAAGARSISILTLTRAAYHLVDGAAS